LLISDSTLLTDPVITELAAKYGVSPATLLISYHTSKGIVVLPKSVSPARIASNLQTVVISDEDLSRLETLASEGKKHRTNKPNWGGDLGFEDWFE
jgi:glycerol 2-dehydrogenase (NADP+)